MTKSHELFDYMLICWSNIHSKFQTSHISIALINKWNIRKFIYLKIIKKNFS